MRRHRRYKTTSF